MNPIFMNSKNSKTFDPHRLWLILTDKINLIRSDKYVALPNLSIYYTWKNIKKSYKNNRFKILAPASNKEFELPGGPYSVWDIQDCFEYILKKHGEKTFNPSIKIYVKKTKIEFKIKEGYYFELLTPKTIKLAQKQSYQYTSYSICISQSKPCSPPSGCITFWIASSTQVDTLR